MKWFLILVSILFCFANVQAAEEPSILAGTIVIQQERGDAHAVLQRYQETTDALLGALEIELGQCDDLGRKLVEEKGLKPEQGKKAGMLRMQVQVLLNAGMSQLGQAEMEVITAESEIEILEAVVKIAKGQRTINKVREVLSECQAELERLDKALPKAPRGADA